MRKKRINIDALKQISIIDVALCLAIPLKQTGSGLWSVKDSNDTLGVTSLTISTSHNRWKRWSGKEQGGVSQGSCIDLVMHWNDCDFKTALEWFESNFPNQI